jgi:hypothetical protein
MSSSAYIDAVFSAWIAPDAWDANIEYATSSLTNSPSASGVWHVI